MKFMLLIGGSRIGWGKLTPEDWSQSEAAHIDLIAQLKVTGGFIECDELDTSRDGARVVRTYPGTTTVSEGPLHDEGEFASGYYLLECADIVRACEIGTAP